MGRYADIDLTHISLLNLVNTGRYIMNGVFCGNGTLLIQCADAFVEKGGKCVGVISSDTTILEWASDHGFPQLGTPENPDVGTSEIDWLFSIANLSILPESLISTAKKGAINFHDGPLPAYAGLNVPAWAIIAGESQHAITWHEMSGLVDTGGIYRQKNFTILDTDTSFSLNVKCYEQGLESYNELLDDLFAGTLTSQPQAGERRLFTGALRPDTLGVLNFDQTAQQLSSLFRGLDFGNYHNPLSLAKVWTGQELVLVGKLEVLGANSEKPGTIVTVADDHLDVSTQDNLVRLSKLTTVAGAEISPRHIELKIGDVFPLVQPIGEDLLKSVGSAEASWNALLKHVVPALPPYPVTHSKDLGANSAPLDVPSMTDTQLGAAFLAWVSSLTDQLQATVGVHRATDHPALADHALVHVCFDESDTANTLSEKFAASLESSLSLAPMPVDLPNRLEDATLREQAQLAQSVIIAFDGLDADILASADLGLITNNPRIVARASCFAPEVLISMASQFSAFAHKFAEQPTHPLNDLPLSTQAELSHTGSDFEGELTIHAAFERQALLTPDAIALEAGAEALSYSELNTRSDKLAGVLLDRGAGAGTVVGVCLNRSADLVIALLAILKTGAAYLPLDPDYPAERITYMIDNSGARIVVASAKTESALGLDPTVTVSPDETSDNVPQELGAAQDLAYLIYTSGSTGAPKGVMVPHKSVQNFFAGMDEIIPHGEGSRLLAVTSVSFDISVLEIFWTLTRGITLVLQTDGPSYSEMPGFSLFYFASEVAGTGHHAYRLLLEGAKFADENGFEAIWTPERHFHAFGGLYPNPAISAAALAGLTKNVKLRAGSAVLPLHHPVRVAEDWALVDNLSNGRAGIAIASGWQPNDFIVRPDAFVERKQLMLDNIDILRALWRGETQTFPGHDGNPVEVEIHPKPMQPEMPLWLTAAGNPETFAAAAEKGCNVLTHLLGQTIEEVAEKIRAYRVAWKDAGHPGKGTVTLMLHTFVGTDEDTVRETVRAPMKNYLKSAVDLVKRASWTFPTIVERANAAGMSPVEMFEKEELSAEDLDQLLDHAFERYYMTSGLFGTPETAKEIVRQVTQIGVDEVGCLIDFGVDTDTALENLPNIKTLMNELEAEGGIGRKASVAEEIVEFNITHLQCTPSMASMLAADEPGQKALSHLEVMMVGGEAFPPDLARSLRGITDGKLFNMYGPTETTIWSSCAELSEVGTEVPLGKPIANTLLDVRTENGRSLPDFVAGELWIGGEGVTDGYWNLPSLTEERFIETVQGTYYKTGDLVRRKPGGVLEFLGRIDNQIKIRGHRIELGEIEAHLNADPSVSAAVVNALEFGEGDMRLVGYVTPAKTMPNSEALKARLASELPDFMIPAQIVVLDSLPTTPNGKVDRKGLPHPKSRASDSEIQAAENEIEVIISNVWCQALGLDEVSVNSNFFDLGGHSLLVVQVQRALKEKLGRNIAITDVFRFPTVRKLGEYLGGETQPKRSAADRGAARAAARLARMGRR